MRIGIVTGEYPPMRGGVGAFSQILARTLAEQGHDLFVFTRAAESAPPHDPSVLVDARPFRRWTFGTLRTISAWARQHRLDVINLQFQTAAFGMSPFIHFLPVALRSIPVVTTFHDLRVPYLFPKAGKVRDWIVMHLARTSNRVIVTNVEDSEHLTDLSTRIIIPIGSNILAPIPPDFDAQAYRAAAGASPSDFLLATFGLINRSKGLETLLEGLAILRNDGVPARLVIIGGGVGSSDPSNVGYMREIDTLIEHLGVAPYIHRTGYLPDDQVGAWLTAADAVALPFRDGASLRRGSLMAAIQYGAAIITTTPQIDVPMFMNFVSMMLHPPGDTAAFVSACKRLYERPEQRELLQYNIKRFAYLLDWKQIASQTADFYAVVVKVNAR